MIRVFQSLVLLASIVVGQASFAADSKQYYEIRSYLLSENSDAVAIDAYLKTSLLPALKRLGVGPVGVFENAPTDETGSARVVLVIPYHDPGQILSVKTALQADQQYLDSAAEYLNRGPREPAYQRIESELLVAMDCMPQLEVKPESLANSSRVYELRIYESANEKLGDLKVDMFNNGEVPIFLDCGIQPIFIGQALIGPFTPSLSYLTVYPNEQAREQAWKDFRVHPEWQVLKEVKKYKGTVSKIYKYVLSPKPFSQM